MEVIINSGEISELKIYEYLENSSLMYSLEDVAQIDVTLIGLNQSEWILEKGKRVYRDYKNIDGESVVSFIYTYELDSDGNIIEYDKKIEFYDTNGNPGIIKPLPIRLSGTYIKNLNREIRQNQIDYLESSAEGLRDTADALPLDSAYDTARAQYNQVADSLDLLFAHYQSEITPYIDRGTSAFKDAVNGEDDPIILSILAIVIDTVSGATVKDSIINQIT